MLAEFDQQLANTLAEIRSQGLYKTERIITSPQDAKIEITGEAEHFNRANWSAGFHIEINVQGAGSGDVNQFDDNIPRELKIDESQIWLRHRKFGQLTWGFVGGTGENAEDLTEDDLSDTTTAGYTGVEDVGGGFFLRRSNVRGVPGQQDTAAAVGHRLPRHVPRSALERRVDE